MDFEQKIYEYAKACIRVGVNLRKNQKLSIVSPIEPECVKLTRALSKEAYKAGAKDVSITWVDEKSTLIRYENAPNEAFLDYPKYLIDKAKHEVDEDYAMISISAVNPDLLKDVDNEKISTWNKTVRTALVDRINSTMRNEVKWLVVSAPTNDYAKKVFPNESTENAVKLLWNEIFKAVRVDGNDAIENWKEHIKTLKNNVKILNDYKFKKLIYKTKDNSTNLTIELPEKHVWAGGGDKTTKGETFCPNMPTEEIYTLPLKTGVNGYVKNTKPFNYSGSLIDDFTLTFENGKIVDFKAKVGHEALEKLLNTDEGSKYLGEVALVPYDSPISNSNITFFNTLYDENASCHLAFGKAYPTSIENGATMTNEELESNGVNMSLIHEDFMIGSSDLDINGITKDDKEIAVFKYGNFAF